jgi:hypothetical protein
MTGSPGLLSLFARGNSGSISTDFSSLVKEISRFCGTNPPIVSEVTINPIDSAGKEEKNGEAG